MSRRGSTEADEGKFTPARATTLTVERALDDLEANYEVNGRKSLGRARGAIRHLRDFFGPAVKAVEVTTPDMESYVRDRLKEKASHATVNYELAILRRALRLKAKAGVLHHVPHFPMLNVDNARKGFVEYGDLRALVDRLPDDVAPVVEFGFFTGWRTHSEVLPLTWDRVDFEHGVVVLYDSKNRAGRTFPFAAVSGLADVLDAQLEKRHALGGRPRTVFFREWRDDLPMMRSTIGKPVSYKRYFLPAWHQACGKAGLEGLIPHDLRRSAVRNLERAGVPRSIAMQLTGHKTEEVYRRYDIVDEADLRLGASQLEAYLSRSGPQFSPQSDPQRGMMEDGWTP